MPAEGAIGRFEPRESQHRVRNVRFTITPIRDGGLKSNLVAGLQNFLLQMFLSHGESHPGQSPPTRRRTTPSWYDTKRRMGKEGQPSPRSEEARFPSSMYDWMTPLSSSVDGVMVFRVAMGGGWYWDGEDKSVEI